MKKVVFYTVLGTASALLIGYATGCTAETQQVFDSFLNPGGAADTLANTPLTELDKALPEYLGKVLTGGAGLTIAGIIGLFTPKPGDKKKQTAAEQAAFDEGRKDGIRTAEAIAKADAKLRATTQGEG